MAITSGGRASHERTVRTTYFSRFAPDAIITGSIGLFVLVLGLVVVIRAGLDGALAEPVVQVLNFDHTAILGLIEIGIGLSLLMIAFTTWRSGEMLFGSLLGIAGLVGAVQADSFSESLALESLMGWIAAGAGLIIVVAAILAPRYGKKSTTLTSG